VGDKPSTSLWQLAKKRVRDLKRRRLPWRARPPREVVSGQQLMVEVLSIIEAANVETHGWMSPEFAADAMRSKILQDVRAIAVRRKRGAQDA
jgi:hypothetical protein